MPLTWFECHSFRNETRLSKGTEKRNDLSHDGRKKDKIVVRSVKLSKGKKKEKRCWPMATNQDEKRDKKKEKSEVNLGRTSMES